jgi:hypothetical protein
MNRLEERSLELHNWTLSGTQWAQRRVTLFSGIFLERASSAVGATVAKRRCPGTLLALVTAWAFPGQGSTGSLRFCARSRGHNKSRMYTV